VFVYRGFLLELSPSLCADSDTSPCEITHVPHMPAVTVKLVANAVYLIDFSMNSTSRMLFFYLMSYFGLVLAKHTHERQDNHFYFVPNGEGLIAHLAHLQELWWSAVIVNSSIWMTGYYSGHYRDVDTVVMCDIFLLPKEISCIYLDGESIMSNYTCYQTGSETRHEEEDDGNDDGEGKVVVQRSQDINFSKISCLYAGFHLPGSEISKRQALVKRNFMSYPYFTKKYLDMLRIVKDALDLTDTQGYWAVHWRRGDQVPTRCKDGKDKSVNCGDEMTFLAHMNRNIEKYRTKGSKIYLATNEQDPDLLNYFEENGILTSKDIIDVFNGIEEPIELSSLDLFVIELTLMCDAKYFMAWGPSSISQFFVDKVCRDASKVTLHDDKNIHGKIGG
jgi:hypothetical protein